VTEAHPAAEPGQRSRGLDAATQSRLAAALIRARWTIVWERLWPALTSLATAIGLFLALSWLGVWLWLPPLVRAAAVIVCAALAIAAAWPFVFVRMPGKRDALGRIDRGSGLPHRPATAIASSKISTCRRR